MRKVIKDLEMQVQKLKSKDVSDKSLDLYVKEIEGLKHRISKYDQERKEIEKLKYLPNRVVDSEENPSSDQEDEGNTYQLSKSNSRFLSANPERTFNMKELDKDEDKDEEIIALQNKIIVFNQQHLNDIKQLEIELNNEHARSVQEKDRTLQRYETKIEQLEQDNSLLRTTNEELRDNCEQTERVFNELQQKLFENTDIAEHEIEESKKSKQKKSKKIKASNYPSQYSFDENMQLKSSEFIIYPGRIIKLLIEAKK